MGSEGLAENTQTFQSNLSAQAQKSGIYDKSSFLVSVVRVLAHIWFLFHDTSQRLFFQFKVVGTVAIVALIGYILFVKRSK